MIKKISESKEKSLYAARFMDGCKDQQKVIDELFDPKMLCTDGVSSFLSYTLLTKITMYLIYMFCIVKKAESTLVANGPDIEVYADNDAAFSGQCLRKYCCEQELINLVMKDIVMVIIIYAIEKALEINDKFCGMQIAAVSAKITGIIDYTDAFHFDRISKSFLKATHKCQQSEQEMLQTFTQRNYEDEIELDQSLPTSLEEWEVWKEAMFESINVQFISPGSKQL